MNAVDKAIRSHDIHVSLEGKEVPEFEIIPAIGMMVSLSLHIRGLPPMEYDKLRQVSSFYFKIPASIFRSIIKDLAEIEFVRLVTEGDTIKKVIPQVPFFEDIYETVGNYSATVYTFNEQETLALTILSKLSGAPTERSRIFDLGADSKIIKRSLDIGSDGGYILSKRARGSDILISPVFFSENADVFADMTAKAGSKRVKKILDLISKAQGWPLKIIETTMAINGELITPEDLGILKSLAQDGAIKPPSITTEHAGENYFLFPPAPGGSKLNPSNREIYERAMALIAAVRQGQLLANKYPIKWPLAILRALKRDGWLRATTESYAQYSTLAIMRIGKLEKKSGGRYQFSLIESEENGKALNLAITLMEDGKMSEMEVNYEARIAMQKDQTYIESIIAASALRQREIVDLSDEAKEEYENLFIKGITV